MEPAESAESQASVDADERPGETHGTWAAAEQPPAPWPRASRAFLAVLLLAGMGLVIVLLGEYRFGSLVFGLALAGGAAARAWLSPDQAGMLVLRGRPFDTTMLSLLSLGVIILALVVPAPS